MNLELFTDEELVLLAKGGNELAKNEIIKRYEIKVKKYIVKNNYYLTNGDHNDLTQEGLIGLSKAISAYESGDFNAFAFKCIKNSIFSAIRNAENGKNKPLKNYVSLSGYSEGDNDKNSMIAVTAFGPEETLINNESLLELQKGIKKVLSDYEYKIFSLTLTGQSIDDISKLLGKDRKSIDNALQRIRKKILNFNG